MTFSDEVLMAYADGELDATTRAQVQQAIGADPELARRVAACKVEECIALELRSGAR